MQGGDFKITLLHESLHSVPAKFSESFFRQFDIAMQLRKDKLKRQGKAEAKVSEVTDENFISMFGFTKDHMLEAATFLETEGNTEKSVLWPDYLPRHHGPENYSKSVNQGNKEVLFIQTGSIKGITFKINVGGLFLSSLFDTGAHVSCIKYDIEAALLW